MFISASLENDYVIIPSGNEFRPFYRVFKDLIEPAEQGYTLAAYDQVPDTLVQDAEYFGNVAKKTRSFDTKQAALTNLQLGINVGDMGIIDTSEGLRLPTGSTIHTTPVGMVLNHIPQLFAIYDSGLLLVNFTGNYNFKSKLFRGQCDFLTPAQIWNE